MDRYSPPIVTKSPNVPAVLATVFPKKLIFCGVLKFFKVVKIATAEIPVPRAVPTIAPKQKLPAAARTLDSFSTS